MRRNYELKEFLCVAEHVVLMAVGGAASWGPVQFPAVWYE